jgi:cell division protein FtsB
VWVVQNKRKKRKTRKKVREVVDTQGFGVFRFLFRFLFRFGGENGKLSMETVL